MSTGPAPIESVDRALRLVEILRDEESVSLTDAAERLGVPPSTAHRLLAALIHRGFAVRDARRRYRSGPALVLRRQLEVTPDSLREVLAPAVEMLQGRVKETVQVLMPRGPDVVYVYGVEPDEPLRVTARSGDRMPAYVAAGGKALLAELPDGEVDRLYADGLPEWPTRHRTSLPELKRELAQVRAQGYGTNLEETEPGVCALGCAVHAPSGRGVAALTIAVPSVRFDGVDTTAYVAALAEARSMAEDLLPADW